MDDTTRDSLDPRAAIEPRESMEMRKPRATRDSLAALAALATRAGAETLAEEAAEVHARLAGGRFVVACVGEFKRGKSTLLNALLGRAILPSGVVPVTSVVTLVRHGPAPSAVIRFRDGPPREVPVDALACYVSEKENPSNRKRVAGVDVALPSPLLEGGMCLVDTPGIGSVFRANSEATRAFLPHVDVALVVLGADPPVSGDELELIEEVRRHADRCLFVLNKADRVSRDDLEEARAFTRDLLGRRLGPSPGPLFAVSAKERLEHTRRREGAAADHRDPCGGRGDGSPPAPRDWSALEEALCSLARDSGAGIVARAEGRWVARLADRLARDLEEQRDALTRPISQSRSRVAALRRAAEEAHQALEDLGAVFLGRQKQLAQTFRKWRAAFLEGAIPDGTRALSDAVGEHPRGGIAGRRAAMAAAVEVARAAVEAWLREAEPRAQAAYRKEARRFIDLAAGLLASSEDFAGEAQRLSASLRSLDLGFRTRCRFYFHDLESSAATSALDALGDVALPRDRTARRAGRKAARYIEELMRVNATRVVNDLDEHVLESRRRLESEILFTLREIVASASRALDRARESHRDGVHATRAALARIDALRAEVESLREITARAVPDPA